MFLLRFFQIPKTLTTTRLLWQWLCLVPVAFILLSPLDCFVAVNVSIWRSFVRFVAFLFCSASTVQVPVSEFRSGENVIHGYVLVEKAINILCSSNPAVIQIEF